MATETTASLAPEKETEIIDGLKTVLASSYLLLVKTHRFHWNVRGPRFFSLHEAFEEQYTELFAAIDDIAERIRALGVLAPGSLAEFSELSEVEEAAEDPKALTMVEVLAADHIRLGKIARELSEKADESGDGATADLMNSRTIAHEKFGWMLRSFLGESE
jgi:starvation-inducible DNA-binding protein